MEQERLLEGDEPSNEPKTPLRTGKKPWIYGLLMHLALAGLYILATYTMLRSLGVAKTDIATTQGQNLRAIDGLDITYSQVSKNIFEMTPYHGEPSSGMDDRWDDLLKSRFIKVSAEELDRNGRDSVEIQPGGPYLAWLGVFHELHCLDFIRRFVHSEYYYPNVTSSLKMRIQNHADHCMDRIQAVIMCHPDYSSLTTMRWTENPKPMVDSVRTLKSCVDWNILVKSLEGRIVPKEDLESLENPLLR